MQRKYDGKMFEALVGQRSCPPTQEKLSSLLLLFLYSTLLTFCFFVCLGDVSVNTRIQEGNLVIQ